MSTNHGIFGYLAGMASAAILQPLQNIKMAIILPPSKLKLSNNFLINLVIASKYIYTEGGARQFYDGLVSNVLKTGTSSAVYFFTMRKLEQYLPKNSAMANFTASACGRIASSLVANPLAVLQTRYEMSGQAKWHGSLLQNLKRVYINEGLLGFYKGGLTSCYKQGSFAGLYYMLYVTGKNYGLNSLVSGMASGIISTAITHPFEIIRANLQGNCQRSITKESIISRLSQLIKNRELLKGVAPRLVKKPLANTISFMIFQTMQKIDKQSDKQ